MIEWFQATPVILIAIALVTVPGLPAAWALQFRGFTLVSASIAASIGIIGAASIVAPLVNMRWSLLPVLLFAGLLALLLLPIRLLRKSTDPVSSTTRSSALWAAGAVGVAALLIGQEVARAIGAPDNISQTYDGVFHLNAAAHILLNGDASPFHMDLNAPGAEGSLYPTLWHSVVALITQLSGASIPVATNAMALATSAWVWPVAILFFSRPFFVRRPVHLMLGAILAANFSAFPYLLLAWGVLYPNLLATALIPLALGFIYPALRHRAIHSLAPLSSLWIAAMGAVGAATLSHPNALFGIAAFTVPMLLVAANDVRVLPVSRAKKAIRWTLLAVPLAVYALMWSAVRTGDNERSYDSSLFKAFVSGISNAPMVEARAWFLTVLVFGGAITLLALRRHRWLLLSYAVALSLYVIAAGLAGPERDVFTGAWYNDAHRLAALLPIGAIPLAAVASSKLLDYVTAGLQDLDASRVSARMRKWLPALGALIVFALLLTGARGQNLALQSGWIDDLHAPQGTLLSEDEKTLLERIPNDVPPGATIAGDPWTGTGLALAFSQRNVLFGHLTGIYGDETNKLATRFNDLGAEACPLLMDLNVTYLLDFGRQKYDVGNKELYAPYVGLHNIQESPIVTEIDREGDAALFKVNCQ